MHPFLTRQGISVKEITYLYDELGRLTAVVDMDRNAAMYRYDAVGNLVSIERGSFAGVSIIGFSPARAITGTPITIIGTGFSITPSENSVAFHGVFATVITATPTQIVTSVPSGETTGAITVTTPSGSATSRIAFTLTERSIAPTITEFTPRIGAAGSVVGITGIGFDAELANNKVIFNRTNALVRSATPTAIGTSVPFGTGSGRITVATPAGQAVSGDDFFIPPLSHTGGDVELTGRVAIGESFTAAINTAMKIGLIVFDGNRGQRVSMTVNDVTIHSGRISIRSPDGTTLASDQIIAAGFDLFIEPAMLPMAGTYTVIIETGDSSTGSLTFRLHDVPRDFTSALAIGGPSVVVGTTAPGQNALLTFEGTAGQRLNLGIANANLSLPNGFVLVSILKPDGTELASTGVLTGREGEIETDPLADTGTYRIIVDPADASTVSLSLTLSEPISGTLIVGGESVSVTIDRHGQTGRFTFAGTAGQRVNLGLRNGSVSPEGGLVGVSILSPDGTLLGSVQVKDHEELDTDPLPETGTYTVLIEPFNGASLASLDLTLSEPITGTFGGPSLLIEINRPGQDAHLTFTGIAGRRVNLHIVGGASPRGALVGVSIVKADGTTLDIAQVSSGGTEFESTADIGIDPLPETGIYTVVVSPFDGAMSANVALTLAS